MNCMRSNLLLLCRAAAFAWILVGMISTGNAAQPREAVLVVDRPLGAAQSAYQEFRRVLTARSVAHREANRAADDAPLVVVIGVAGKSPELDGLLKKLQLQVPGEPESLLMQAVGDRSARRLLLAGSDARGLSYALLEAARAIERAVGQPWENAIANAKESPFLRVRSVTMQLFNHDVDGPWYRDDAFWRWYLQMLARHRFNNLTLTFAHQTNYMNPVYPWLLETPGFAEVKVIGLSDAERARNLARLQRIGELAHEQGLDLTLGLWTQQPVARYGRDYLKHFPQGEKAADYAAASLAALLKACPVIDAVQFRMNLEAGVAEEEQLGYFQSQFDAIQNCGRPVRLDLRYKGLSVETIEQAVRSGVDLTVSTKFWCEHMGLPHHPTVEDERYRESRYGYGAMLAKPRDFRVVYRLWTVGSQRLLLWGDPTYAARFARSCTLGGGEGFEIFAPLTNKGFGDDPGDWRILANKSDEYYRWEQERYWMFYLTLGRCGYNPQTAANVWQREFQHRFGQAAAATENAVRQASGVLPLLTATRLFSASEWWYWPEMHPGGTLNAYAVTQPSDYGQFYAIARWRPVPDWPAEPWEAAHRGFVEDALQDQVEAKTTPLQVSNELEQLAHQTRESVRLARQQAATAMLSKQAERELRSTLGDCSILENLARFHAARIRAATDLEFFRETQQKGRLLAARRHALQALDAWKQIVALTADVYHENLVFGYGKGRAQVKEHTRMAHTGHWKDRTAEVEADIRLLDRLLEQHQVDEQRDRDFRLYPGEEQPTALPHISPFDLPRSAAAGQPLRISAQVESKTPLRSVLLHYRPLDQTVDWRQMEMQKSPDGNYTAEIPAAAIDARYDLMVYLEARIAGGGTLWPDRRQRQPYVVLPTLLQP